MTQSEIDAASKSKVGTTPAERGKSRKIMADLLAFADQANTDFYKFVFRIFPQLGEFTGKSVLKDHECGDECAHVVHKVEAFNTRQSQGINDLFRRNYPSQWAQMNQYAYDWQQSLMNGNLPNRGAPFSQGYWDMLQQGANFGYQSAIANAPKGLFELPPMPFVVNSGEDFIKKIYADGYGLVTSQITQTALPLAQQSINQALSEGKTWDEITQELNAQHGATAAHWARLVRSEMAMSANAGTMAQAKALNEPSTVIKWSTSVNSVCDVCGPRNGVLYELDAPEVTSLLPHPNCMCARVVTFRKRAKE